jgi:hypothetical protein
MGNFYRKLSETRTAVFRWIAGHPFLRRARANIGRRSGKGAALPLPPPLRTVLESFPSYGSSKSLTTPLPWPLSCRVVLASPPGAFARKGVALQQGPSEASNSSPSVRPCRPQGQRRRWRVSRVAHFTGPFANPEGPHLTCPVTSNLSPVLRVTHPTHVSGLSAWARGPIHRVMTSPCLSAGGLRFLGHLVPAAGLGRPSEDRPAYWLGTRPQRGCRVPHLMRSDGGGRLLYCGAGVSLTGLRVGAGPVAQIVASAIRAATFAYAASMKVHWRSPFPSFPGPVHPDGSDSPWALPACSRMLRYLALARVGNRHRHISGSWRLNPRPLIKCDFRVALPCAE